MHIDETPIDFWTIQGMKPADAGSEAEKHFARDRGYRWEIHWVKENRPSAYAR